MTPECNSKDQRLDSWKEIATYLGRTERTVHRWEDREGLPVHRLQHEKRGSVFAYTAELDAWREARREVEPAPPEPAVIRSPNLRRRWLLIGLAAVVIVGGGLAAWRFSPRGTGPREALSVAVLPLENLSGDSQQDYFVDGMTDELITELAKIRSLRVISRTSVMRYKKTLKPLTQIARELNVDAVVEGEVLRSGDRVRITAQLIHAGTDRHLWAETYERDLRDVLAIQEEVAKAVASQVQGSVNPQEKTKVTAGQPASFEVREAYLRGRYHLNKGSEPEIRSAIQYFQRALELDPAYAPAYAGLADCYVAFTDSYLPPSESMPKAREAALHALQLDEKLAEAHTSLGVVHFLSEWDWKAAEKEFKRALEINANDVDAHVWYANFLAQMSRPKEAAAEIRRAEQIDPLSLNVYLNASWIFYLDRREDEVARALQNALDLEPTFPVTHSTLWLGYAPKALTSALAPLQELAKPDPANPLSLAILAAFDAIEGKKDDAHRLLAQLNRLSGQRYVCPYEMAATHAALNESHSAYQWLEEAYRERSICLPDLKTDPRFDSLRAESRFQNLLRRVGFTP